MNRVTVAVLATVCRSFCWVAEFSLTFCAMTREPLEELLRTPVGVAGSCHSDQRGRVES